MAEQQHPVACRRLLTPLSQCSKQAMLGCKRKQIAQITLQQLTLQVLLALVCPCATAAQRHSAASCLSCSGSAAPTAAAENHVRQRCFFPWGKQQWWVGGFVTFEA